MPYHANICNATYSCRHTTVDRDQRSLDPIGLADKNRPATQGTMQTTSLEIGDDNKSTKVNGVLLINGLETPS